MSSTLRLNRTLKYETFPHRCVLGQLDFWIKEFSIDGDDPVQPDNQRHLNLDDYQGWTEVEFTLKVEIPNDLLPKVFPGDNSDRDSDSYPGTVLVAGHCVETYTRAGVVLNEGGTVSATTVSGTLCIKSNNVVGKLSLHPYLLRSEPLTDANASALGLDSTHNYATEQGSILSDGPKSQIQVTDKEPGSDDVLQVERTSFEEENEDEDSPFPANDRMYYLDLKRDPDNPVLYFNEDHNQVVDIIWNGDGRYDDLTSDLVWDHVMSSVWARMVQVAADEYDSDAEAWTPEWQPAVFEMLNEHMYSDEDTSPRKAAEFLAEELDQDPLSATERIEQAVQGLLDPARQFDNHATRLGNR